MVRGYQLVLFLTMRPHLTASLGLNGAVPEHEACVVPVRRSPPTVQRTSEMMSILRGQLVNPAITDISHYCALDFIASIKLYLD
jgi:hypothetical protein